jgi:hypothetical protein
MERALSFQSPFFVCIAGTTLQGYAMNGPADSQSIGKCGRIESMNTLRRRHVWGRSDPS